MAIDDKLDQAIAQVRIDEALRGPGFARLGRKIAEGFATGGVVGMLAAFSDGLNSEAADWSAENSAYLLSIVIEEVKRLSLTIDELAQQHQEFLNRDWIPLLIDADRKARATRAKGRVERIARIVSNSALVGPATPADEVEEMMHIAMELSDADVVYLQKLVAVEGTQVRDQGRITRFNAHMMWPWGDTPDAELDSTFSKLESYGLVSRIPPLNTLNVQADFQNRYVLLRKGLNFIDFAREAEATRSPT
jgi:hypothetical protein